MHILFFSVFSAGLLAFIVSLCMTELRFISTDDQLCRSHTFWCGVSYFISAICATGLLKIGDNLPEGFLLGLAVFGVVLGTVFFVDHVLNGKALNATIVDTKSVTHVAP